jgi:hypothetical protein
MKRVPEDFLTKNRDERDIMSKKIDGALGYSRALAGISGLSTIGAVVPDPES